LDLGAYLVKLCWVYPEQPRVSLMHWAIDGLRWLCLRRQCRWVALRKLDWAYAEPSVLLMRWVIDVLPRGHVFFAAVVQTEQFAELLRYYG
jgi:hypothetical protein